MLGVFLLTLIGCIIFVAYNPTIAVNYTTEYADGEIITPENGQYDFRIFTINSSSSKFTANVVTPGHTRFDDDTGNVTINVIELDKMINVKKDDANEFLNGEIKKPAWSVDGVTVHQIDFMTHDSLYSSYQKNSTTNVIIYIATPNEQDTANMMNSLVFK